LATTGFGTVQRAQQAQADISEKQACGTTPPSFDTPEHDVQIAKAGLAAVPAELNLGVAVCRRAGSTSDYQ
jgi:hypothetical protein